MDDAKIGRDIRERAYELMNGKRGLVPSDADLGRAAREVLAKPVATREAVRPWHHTYMREKHPTFPYNNAHDIDMILAAISYFAPPARPRMMIEGMSVEDIAAEFRNSWHSPDRPATDQWYSQHVARVAHRLANTPAPEHDPDEEAKAICWKYQQASGMKRHETSEDAWAHQSLESRNGWRAVAASKKEAGGE